MPSLDESTDNEAMQVGAGALRKLADSIRPDSLFPEVDAAMKQFKKQLKLDENSIEKWLYWQN